MRAGLLISSGLAVTAGVTVLAFAASSVQFGVGVTVISPCTISVTASVPRTPVAAERQPAGPPARSSCSAQPSVSFESAAPAASSAAASAPGLRRVTISY